MSEISRKVKEQYQSPPETGCGEKLVLDFLPLVKRIASRLSVALPPSLEGEDLIGCGIVGLLEARERYDPSRGASFATFAAWRIKGAMIDELRTLTPSPRAQFSRLRQLNAVSECLQQERQREPEQSEIAAALGWSISAVEQIWAYCNLLSISSLDAMLFTLSGEESLLAGEAEPLTAETPETAAIKKEQQQLLAAALGQLAEREKLVLSLCYMEELSQKDIAGLLNISTGRVSQLHARAILRLREILTAQEE